MFVSTPEGIGGDPGEAGQSFGEPPGPAMVLGQSRPVVFERVESPRRHEPRLPETAAEEMAEPPGSLDHGGAARQAGSHRSTETLRKTDAHRVEALGVAALGDPGGGGGVPEPRPVEMGRQTELARGVRDLPQNVQRPDRAAGAVMRVLGGKEPRNGIAGLRHHGVRAPDRVPHLLRRKHSTFPVKTHDGRTGERGRASAFHEIGVGAALGQHQIARLGLAADGDLVAHRAGRGEHRGVLPEDLGGALFEAADRGIVAVHIVAHFGGGHDRPHFRRGERDGVAAEIDPDRSSGGGLGHSGSSRVCRCGSNA